MYTSRLLNLRNLLSNAIHVRAGAHAHTRISVAGEKVQQVPQVPHQRGV